MTLTPRALTQLVLDSIRTPQEAAAIIQSAPLDRATRWQLLIAMVLAGTVTSVLMTFVLTGRVGMFLGVLIASPWVGAMIGLSAAILTVYAIFWIGRAMGGQGSFEDTLLLVGWLQFVVICLQIVQLAVFLLLPPISGLVDIAAALLSIWMLTNFIAALHGFTSLAKVFLMILVAAFAMAFGLSLFLALIGVTVPGVT